MLMGISARLFAQESDPASQTKLYRILFNTTADSATYESSDSVFSGAYRMSYNPWLGASNDLGVFLGASVYLFKKIDSLYSVTSLRGGYATGPSKYTVEYNSLYPNIMSGTFSVDAKASSLDILNFFGYGNETAFNKNAYSAAAYRLNQQQFSLSGIYAYTLVENTSLWGSAALRYINTDADPITDTTVIQKRYEYGVGKYTTARFGIGGIYDSRDNPRAASKGLIASFGSYWTPEIINNKYAYTKFIADIRGFVSAEVLTQCTLALRMRVEKIFGEHPFYEACLLGGVNDLRGYYQDRFAGEESLLGSGELRITIGSAHIFVPERYGIFLCADAGRVYIDNDFSNAWHTSFGGGVWVAPVSSDHTISLTVAHSSEATLLYLGSGFTF
jgi:outer membrane protein assembly factor BamA